MMQIRYYTLFVFLKCLSFLSLNCLYLLSDLLYLVMYYIIRYRRKVVFANLLKSFPEITEKSRKAIAKKFYKHLCDCIVEDIKLLHISKEELGRRINVLNAELIESLAKDGKSIIVLLGHYGNWEWIQEVTNHYCQPYINAEIYRPAKSLVFNKVLSRMRSRFSTMQIEQKQAVRTLLRLHNEGKQFLVGFISDQRPNSKNLNHWLEFLNQETAIAIGGEDIGNHIDAHFVYLDIEKPKRGYYAFTFKEIHPIDDDKEFPITRAFFTMFEKTIRREPAYWLWSHKRWRFSRKTNHIIK